MVTETLSDALEFFGIDAFFSDAQSEAKEKLQDEFSTIRDSEANAVGRALQQMFADGATGNVTVEMPETIWDHIWENDHTISLPSQAILLEQRYGNFSDQEATALRGIMRAAMSGAAEGAFLSGQTKAELKALEGKDADARIADRAYGYSRDVYVTAYGQLVQHYTSRYDTVWSAEEIRERANIMAADMAGLAPLATTPTGDTISATDFDPAYKAAALNTRRDDRTGAYKIASDMLQGVDYGKDDIDSWQGWFWNSSFGLVLRLIGPFFGLDDKVTNSSALENNAGTLTAGASADIGGVVQAVTQYDTEVQTRTALATRAATRLDALGVTEEPIKTFYAKAIERGLINESEFSTHIESNNTMDAADLQVIYDVAMGGGVTLDEAMKRLSDITFEPSGSETKAHLTYSRGASKAQVSAASYSSVH